METKILVGVPTFDKMKYCEKEFLERVKALDFPKYDILIVDNSKSEDYFNELKKILGISVIRDQTKEEKSIYRLISSRNIILDFGVKNNFTHVLLLDSDVIPPKNVITELINSNKDIVSGVYNNYFNVANQTKFLPVAWKSITQEEFDEIKKIYPLPENIKTKADIRRHLTQEELDSNEVQEVVLPSCGCLLLSRRVFEIIRFSREKNHVGTGEDYFFMKSAIEKGFTPFCNTRVKCEHLVKDKYKKDKNGNLVHSSFSDLI